MSRQWTSVVPLSFELSRLRRLFLVVDERFNDGCAGRVQRRLKGATDFVRALTMEAVRAACFRESYEVDRRQRASIFRIADFLLLEFYLGQAIVLEDDNLHRKLI